VAECIRLGLSTHQPFLTNIDKDMVNLKRKLENKDFMSHRDGRFTSPFLSAIEEILPVVGMRGLLVVFKMLHESGATSNAELFRVYQAVLEEQDNVIPERILLSVCTHLVAVLKSMATTPRSLMSLCRQVISHCLHPRRRRHRDVECFDELPPRMKRYVMFEDITDPDYGTTAVHRFDYKPSLMAAIEKTRETARMDLARQELARRPHQRWFVTSSYPTHGPYISH
jgi:hypothetical protein